LKVFVPTVIPFQVAVTTQFAGVPAVDCVTAIVRSLPVSVATAVVAAGAVATPAVASVFATATQQALLFVETKLA